MRFLGPGGKGGNSALCNRGMGYGEHKDLQADTPLGDERREKSGPCVVDLGLHTFLYTTFLSSRCSVCFCYITDETSCTNRGFWVFLIRCTMRGKYNWDIGKLWASFNEIHQNKTSALIE